MTDDRLTSVVVVGARGRMGQSLMSEVLASDSMTLAGAVARPGAPGLREDVGPLVGHRNVGVMLSDELVPGRNDVVVDFSLPEATEGYLAACVERRVPLVLGTTGLTEQTQAHLREAATEIPIVAAANFSVGVTVMIHLAGATAKALGTEWEAEMFEIHHRHKRDAPSGTALRVGQAVAEATGRDFDAVRKTNRDAVGPRSRDEIGIMALRGGDVVGEHTLMVLGESERIELTHRALDRAIFSRGALRAARWVGGKAPGLYDMFDVLDLHGV
jgi:4-hydroxy-tetrahydrodipicolinate reductase